MAHEFEPKIVVPSSPPNADGLQLLVEALALMKVAIKDFGLDLDIKNRGIEVSVADNDGGHKGDLYVTKTGLIWCTGRTARENGKKISWDDFINDMVQR